ncbi:MAG: alpha/beta hydrolase [Candidatus Hydrogenedentales bacterium]|jgi:acetyl esterase/lipase
MAFRASTLFAALLAIALAGCHTYDTYLIQRKWIDIPYATVSPFQKLDIYLPNEGSGPFPVIVSIHGGGFSFGDKFGGDLRPALTGLARGYAVAAVNYRLSGEAPFPAQINDVKAAIRFLRANAANYQLNTSKIAVWGSSAGGGLAALAGTSGGVKALADPALGNAGQSDKVQAVVDWYGPINFLTMDGQFKQSGIDGMVHNEADSFESKLMGKQITLVPDLVRKANPETYITANDPPFFIQHGDADKLIPSQQSAEFAKKLQQKLGKSKVTFELLPGAGHGDAKFVTAENTAKVLDFLDKVLK